MPLRPEDLSPELRRRLAELEGRPSKVEESRGRAAGRRPERRGPWRCRTCGETFTAWATAQRHANDHGGARLELVLDDGST